MSPYLGLLCLPALCTPKLCGSFPSLAFSGLQPPPYLLCSMKSYSWRRPEVFPPQDAPLLACSVPATPTDSSFGEPSLNISLFVCDGDVLLQHLKLNTHLLSILKFRPRPHPWLLGLRLSPTVHAAFEILVSDYAIILALLIVLLICVSCGPGESSMRGRKTVFLFVVSSVPCGGFAT